MSASAFDLLRSAQRRTRQAPLPHAPLLDGSGSLGGGATGGDRAPARKPGPLRPDAVGCDERVGLWWAIEGDELRYFPLHGSQWPPSAVHKLPEDAVLSAQCVALLTGLGAGSGRAAGPCTVAVLPDLRVVVFSRGERQDVPRPPTAPLAQVPAFVAAAAPHPAPGAAGVVLVVGSRAGGLFGIFLRQRGEVFEAEASPLWSVSGGPGGLRNWLKRVRRSLSGAPEPMAEELATFLVRSVEVVTPPAGSDALFSVLAVSDEAIACFLQPKREAAPAELAWLITGGQLSAAQPPPRLLRVKCTGEDPKEMLLLYTAGSANQESGDSEKAGVSTVAALLPWPSRSEPPTAPGVGGVLAVGPDAKSPAMGGQAAFLTATSQLIAIAVRLQEQRWLLTVVHITAEGLQVAEGNPIEADVFGLALLAAPGLGVLTPHGLLAIPAPGARLSEQPSTEDALPPGGEGNPTEALRFAYTLYSTGQEERAVAAVAQALCVHGVVAVLAAVESCTAGLLDASDVSGQRWKGVAEEVVTRHLLFDKGRDLEQWAAFLSETGAWGRLAALPGAVVARQALSEACERVAAASHIRELQDREPEVIGGAIHRAVHEAEFGSQRDLSLSEAHRFYAQASSCEQILRCLSDYPRALPLGSAGVANAVIFANSVAVGFLEAALERRGQLLARHPLLLPPPQQELTQRHLESSVRPPRGLGSSWLISSRTRQALEDLRLVSLEVLPPEPLQGLPFLEAQAGGILDSLCALCRVSLRAASASYCDLHDGPMVPLRASVLEHLAEAEARFAPVGSCLRRTLELAREFEDFETMVNLLACSDADRLEEQLALSAGFRSHALRQFLRTQALQPWFFRTAHRFQLTPREVEEVLVPYPELRWTLEVEGLNQHSPEATWRGALEEVERRAVNTLQRERHSAAKRDAFAALTALARRAAGKGEGCDEAVAEATSLGRLQQVCHRFSQGASVGSKRPSPSGPPVSAEDCLRSLSDCFRVASAGLRAEGSEKRLFADAARLVRLLERVLCERGVDIGPLLLHEPGEDPLAASKDQVLIHAVQRLWVEVILADEKTWAEVLVAPEGKARDVSIESTGFYSMLAWRGWTGPAPWTLPRSADLLPLCGTFDNLCPLAPALRLAEAAAKAAASVPSAASFAGASLYKP